MLSCYYFPSEKKMRAYEKLPVARKHKTRAIPKIWKRYLDDSVNFVH